LEEVIKKFIDTEENAPAILVTHHNVTVEQFYIDDLAVDITSVGGSNRRAAECGEPQHCKAIKVVGYEDTGPCESEPC